MSTRADERALKLHLGRDGLVWFADGRCPPALSGQTSEEFLAGLSRDAPLLRILGTHHNAQLLSQAYARCQQLGGRLEAASPLACTAAARCDPAAALHYARQMTLPASLGGWHRVSEAELPAYELAASVYAWSSSGGDSQRLLERHPAWTALRFVQGVSPEWAAWLLAFILDPRWFIDPAHPDRSSRLQSYLGLLPRTQRLASANCVESAKAARCRAALMTWQSGGEPACRDAPGCFLWRVHAAAGGGWRGDLRGSQRLVLLLRHAWLAALCDGERRGGESLFDAAAFFKTPSEIAAYRAHQEACAG